MQLACTPRKQRAQVMHDQTPDEIHVASFLVHVRPEQLADLTNVLAATPGLEEGTRDPSGKLGALVMTLTRWPACTQ